MIETALKKLKGKSIPCEFGMEKENLRVDAKGNLSLTPHPEVFGNKRKNPYITTDFSESQIEMITPVLSSIEETYMFMRTLHDVVSDEIGDELLWNQSLPPYLPEEDDIPISRYDDDNKNLELYRERLSFVYGKYRQLLCGIHFNISFHNSFFEDLQREIGNGVSIDTLKEQVYLKTTRGLMRHRWLLLWLYGNTPLAEPNFHVRSLKDGNNTPLRCGDSIALRSGPLGYRNNKDFIMDFTSTENYHKVVDQLVEEGELYAAKELYQPIRMKFLGEQSDTPSYLELRFIDLDPFDPCGVNKEMLYAIHILYLYTLLQTESGDFDAAAQTEATLRQDIASCKGRCNDARFPEGVANGAKIADEALVLIRQIKQLLDEYGLLNDPTYAKVLEQMEHLAIDPQQRKGVRIYKDIKEKGFVEHHLQLMTQYKAEATQTGYRFWGRESMEMSTQLLMRAALCKGINIEILDPSENFLRLSYEGKEQLVVQATKTAIDNYATVLAMENKVVTKKLLSEKSISVPAGGEYFTKESAWSQYETYANRPIVIKPKSTNFGIGITILKEGATRENYDKALDIAFAHDNCVLIEQFVEGREFRIFVIDNQVVGILHRVPANVLGDGQKSIRQLIEQKNLDPRRGKGYRTPLEKIALGQEEELFLSLQGATFDTIVPKGKRTYLRENSNISTGGDSIDFTDEVHHSYKQIAIQAAKAVGARITGVDMMIQHIHQPATPDNYSIIEINFNPAIHIHCFPYEGKNRRLHYKIIDALFPNKQ